MKRSAAAFAVVILLFAANTAHPAQVARASKKSPPASAIPSHVAAPRAACEA